MKLLTILIALITLGLQLPTVLADTTSPGGFVVSVKVNMAGSDDFSIVRGRLTILQASDQEQVEYVWGGSNCPNRDLTEAQIELLFDVAAEPYMILTPAWVAGQLPGTRCLVSFAASNQKFD